VDIRGLVQTAQPAVNLYNRSGIIVQMMS